MAIQKDRSQTPIADFIDLHKSARKVTSYSSSDPLSPVTTAGMQSRKRSRPLDRGLIIPKPKIHRTHYRASEEEGKPSGQEATSEDEEEAEASEEAEDEIEASEEEEDEVETCEEL